MLLTWSADGELAPVQLSKQKNRLGSHTAQQKCIGCLMGRVDAPTGTEEAEAGEGCPGSFEAHGKVVECVYLQILRTAGSPKSLPLGPCPACSGPACHPTHGSSGKADHQQCLETLAQH